MTGEIMKETTDTKNENRLNDWWNAKDSQDKFWFFVKTFCLLIVAAYFLLLAFGRFFLRNDGLFYSSINFFIKSGKVNVWLRCLSYIIFVMSVTKAVRVLLQYIFTFLKKGRAVINLISSFIKYMAVIIMVFLILKEFGVNTTALLAGAGILSLVVGLGAQPLIEDIIAGLFIVFEKTFDVGDIIVVDGFRGTVKEIGIRTTKIEDAGGDIKVINNSDVRTLVNMTSELSLAVCDVDIGYGESLERVEAVIEKNLNAIKESIPSITEGPFYKGVAVLGSSGVTLRFFARCPEPEKFQTERDLNRQIKLLFDKNNISIPYPQIVLHNADDKRTIQVFRGSKANYDELTQDGKIFEATDNEIIN